MANRCRHCNEIVPLNTIHECEVTGETYENEDNSGDFLISAAIGYATDSALLGGLIGGDLGGGLLGDALNGDDDGGGLLDDILD